MAYLYETHMHTCYASACGRSTGREHVRYYKERGYQGIIITDHFFGGNTCVPHEGSWRDRIDHYCMGYEDAWEEGQRLGLDVFFGWEQNFDGDEYLVYGLDKQWLLDHPEMEHWTRRQQLEEVHKYGGCVIQAHPFRTRGYIKRVLLGLQYADGIEVANTQNLRHNDVYALNYGREYDLVMTAGSDNHNSVTAAQMPGSLTGVLLDERLTSIKDYVNIILGRGKIGLDLPEDYFELPEEEMQYIESFWLDDSENIVPTGRDWAHEK